MAQQKFDIDFREALWKAHGKRCIYCREPVRLFDMRIDHVIPEHLAHGDPDRRIAVLEEIGLPPDFNIRGHGNLAPSCDQCNSTKSGDVLVESTNPVTLTRVAKALGKLRKLLEQQKSVKEIDEAILIISRALEQKKFTAEDFVDRLKNVFPGMIPEEGWPEPNTEAQVNLRTWFWKDASSIEFSACAAVQVNLKIGLFSFTVNLAFSFSAHYKFADLRYLESGSPELLQYHRSEETGVFSLFVGLGDDDPDTRDDLENKTFRLPP